MSALSSFTPGGVAGVFNFNVTGAPPFTTLKTFINGIDYSPLVAPDSTGTVGSPLTTDRSGAASGKLTVIRTYGGLSVDGSLDVSFYDPSTKLTVSRFSIAGVDSAPDASINSTRSSLSISSIKSAAAETDVADAAKLGGATSILTPFTQTFFVDGTKYPKGIFVSSVELWFATKDTIAPVSIQLRKVIGGVPSSNEIIPGSVCVVNAANVNVPANAILTTALTSSSSYTKFPILSKLPPGEYGISILTDSKEYSIYSSVFGQAGPGGSGVAQKEPYIGKLFKSQNTNTWLEESNKSLCFAVNKAQFYKGTAFFELQTQAIPSTLYDTIFLDSATTGEGEVSGINYTVNNVNEYSAPGTLSGAVPLNPNQALLLDERKKAVAAGDIKIGITFTNDSLDVSPVLDKSRLSLYTFANEIDPYEADTRSAELLPSGGIAHSRYISKVVTLATGFDSTGLEVKLDVNRKIGTDIDVFCRVMSSTDINTNNSIDNLPWKRMPLYNQNATITSPDSIEGKKTYAGTEETFSTEIYKILETDSAATTGFDNLYYTALAGDTVTTFKDFNRFQIKVVFYSFDSTIIPKIKNLIATSVI
jgi:hypothetical protein